MFRAGAIAVDVGPAIAVVSTAVLVSCTVPLRGAWWWVSMSVGAIAFLLMLVNRLLLPAVTGWSLGRALFGIAVVRRDAEAGEPAGAWLLLLREAAHLLDTVAVFVGWLWPLWDSRHRSFADMVAGTEVHRADSAERPAKIRQWTAAAVVVGAVICLGGAAVSYAVVYSNGQATDRTKAQIAVAGPKIVAQMLTYDPSTLAEDFKRAQSLATDKYRRELVAQQEVVQKGHPVINEYWVTASSIQSASPDRATMLLFMQGRRGASPEERYITATVRVVFAKDGGGQWRVDELTVVTKPKQPGPAK